MRLRPLSLTVVASAVLFSFSAIAADCPPLGALPAYKAGEITRRDHASMAFRVAKGDEYEDIEVAGKSCAQSYEVKEGANVMSDLEIQSNYRQQLQKLGAQIVFKDDRNTTAKFVKGAQETWIKVYSQENEIEVGVIEKTPFKATLTAPGPNDYRLLGHMPNYMAAKPEKRNFDKAAFKVQEGDDWREVEAQGAKFSVNYEGKPNSLASDLDIQENYRAALKALSAQLLFSDDRNTVARLEDKGQTIWVKVYSQENEIEVVAIEEKAFEASIKPPEASALKTALEKDGHVALYVNFDFAKATLKPDAAPVVTQIVKLLKDNPSLKVSIDGHTDNVGGHDYNVKLSQERAAAVVAAISAQGIAKERMQSAGFGPDKPIDDNEKPEGRAKNRRVELVKS